ncbi:PREDICTED: uncharacterized protein LOC105561201, partial [Vollenhovia emeryi]|uniref:uncharacterized protein LOC105561201 n=1 Tax=Vollenhovia emeryi TaxID=411798 RepID=UPI0005F38D51
MSRQFGIKEEGGERGAGKGEQTGREKRSGGEKRVIERVYERSTVESGRRLAGEFESSRVREIESAGVRKCEEEGRQKISDGRGEGARARAVDPSGRGGEAIRAREYGRCTRGAGSVGVKANDKVSSRGVRENGGRQRRKGGGEEVRKVKVGEEKSEGEVREAESG